MPDNSFDVVSEIVMPEVNNAIQQAMKEIVVVDHIGATPRKF